MITMMKILTGPINSSLVEMTTAGRKQQSLMGQSREAIVILMGTGCRKLSTTGLEQTLSLR